MKEPATRDLVFARRPSGAVRLNIGLGPAQAPGAEDAPPSLAHDDSPGADAMHPLLLLYPFDSSPESGEPAIQAPAPHRDTVPEMTSSFPDGESEVFNTELDDEVITNHAPASPVAAISNVKGARIAKRSRHKKMRHRMRLPGVSELEGLWVRHGMLLSALIICHAAASYQLAATYRHFMKLGVSAGSLMPAMFLGLMFASFAVIRLMDGRRFESVAISIIAMTGASALLGLVCKVLLIVREGA